MHFHTEIQRMAVLHDTEMAEAALQDWSWTLQFNCTSFSSNIPTSGFISKMGFLNLNRCLLIFSNKEQLFHDGETLTEEI